VAIELRSTGQKGYTVDRESSINWTRALGWQTTRLEKSKLKDEALKSAQTGNDKGKNSEDSRSISSGRTFAFKSLY
jgi:hypothetical protein